MRPHVSQLNEKLSVENIYFWQTQPFLCTLTYHMLFIAFQHAENSFVDIQITDRQNVNILVNCRHKNEDVSY
jgi:hypothetical protein